MITFFAIIGITAVIFFPVLYIWCIVPNKSIQDGLREWIEESANDF